jgi:hypothetical protein
MGQLKLLSQPRYILLAVTVAFAVTAFSAWLPNLGLVQKAIFSSTMTIGQKTNLLVALFGSLKTNFTFLSLVITLFTAVLSGIQVSLLTHYLRESFKINQALGTSTLGFVSSMLGIGCASCGSVAITSFLGLGASASVLIFLPLKGQEFGFIGIILLLVSILYTAKKINQPITCKVKE